MTKIRIQPTIAPDEAPALTHQSILIASVFEPDVWWGAHGYDALTWGDGGSPYIWDQGVSRRLS